MDDSELLDALVADVATVIEVLRSSPTEAVPSCPGWSVVDLVKHHGSVLRWATQIVETGEPVVDRFSGPDGVTELANWYSTSAAGFVDIARGVDPARECWTFGRPPAKAWFWTRRQMLEAAIHRWDAQLTIGRATDFMAGVAMLGITEVVEDLFPRQLALGRTTGLSALVALQATDAEARRWVLGDDPSDEPDAIVEAPAAALLLLLWGRTDLDDGTVSFSGSPQLREEIRTARFTP